MKKFIYGLLIVIGLLLIGSLFISSKFHNERSIVVKAPVAVVFDQANTLKNWEKWSPWQRMDPTMKIVYNDIATGKGASYSWEGESNKVGKGTMTISNSVPNELIEYEMTFEGQGGSNSSHRFEQMGDSVKVIWTFDTDLGMNPIAKYMMTMMSGMMEETFDNGLRDMKAAAEAMPATVMTSDIKVEEIEMKEAMPFLGIKAKATGATISGEMGKCYGMIGAAIQKQGLEVSKTMAPFATWYKWENDQFEFDACMATNKAGKSDGEIFAGEMKAGKYLVAHYFGDYMGTVKGHDAIDAYAKANNKQFAGAPSEFYVTDPMIEKDTAKWQTDIYYPLQ